MNTTHEYTTCTLVTIIGIGITIIVITDQTGFRIVVTVRCGTQCPNVVGTEIDTQVREMHLVDDVVCILRFQDV